MHYRFISSKYIIRIIFGLIFLGCIEQRSLAQDSIKDYISTITTKDIDKTWLGLQTNDKNIYTVFNLLCTNIIKKGTITLPEGNTYNPQESIFVTVICNSLQSKEKNKTAKLPEDKLLTNKILKRKNIRDMGIICSQSQIGVLNNNNGIIGDTDCENRSFDNNMDYPFIFQKIITKVENDRINLSLARIYGSINTEANATDLANIYIMNHFNTIGFLPEIKNYPTTYKKLTEYIKNGKNMQKETYFIDYSKITQTNINTDAQPKQSLFFLNTSPTQIDIITTQSTYHKINTDILYNEIFFYTLFISIYKEYLNRFWENSTKDIPISRKQRNISDGEAIILQQTRINTQLENIKNAIHESIRQLSNLEASYPMHIGFLMYQEDLLNMRDNLVKIYLPLHQLHYKLENVQSKN